MFKVVENRAAQETFLKARFVIFRCQKYVKKGYMEMEKQLYLDSNVKYCDLKDFLKAQFVIFRCQKYVKKGTWKWENEFTLRL